MSDHDGIWTVLVAAGSASRFGADKLGVALDGDRTVLDLSIEAAMAASEGTVVVVASGDPVLHATRGLSDWHSPRGAPRGASPYAWAWRRCPTGRRSCWCMTRRGRWPTRQCLRA